VPDPALTLLILLLGFAAGFVNALAGGGSVLTVPAIILAGFPPAVAIATNRFAITFMGLASLWRYQQAGLVRLRLALGQTGAALVGAVIGARITLSLDPTTLKRAIALVMLAFILLAFRPKPNAKPEDTASPAQHSTAHAFVAYALAPFLLGVYGGFYGAGVSTLFILLDVGLERTSFLEAAATTQLVLAALSAAATLTFALEGAISWQLGVPLAVSMSAGAWVGANTAIKRGEGLVKTTCAVVGVILAIVLFI
jgi:uncharacterized membrane protein YfcA